MASLFSNILLLLLILPCCRVLAQTTPGTIDVGWTLTAGDRNASPLLSPNQDFAFGFQQLEGDQNRDLFVLAIWFHNIPDQNIVWYPKETKPAYKGSKVELTADRGFVLNDPKAEVDLWQSSVSNGQAATGFLNNSGNLVLRNKNSEYLWESFENPSDTMLPGQVLRKGESILSSRQSETNFSLGKFQLRLIRDGNLVLNTINIPTGLTYDAYFWSDTVDANVSNAGKLMVFNESGSLYVLRENDGIVRISNVADLPATDNHLRATLGFDGVFTMYYFPKKGTASGNGSWSALWTRPDNICTAIDGSVGTGPCGYNSVCTINNDRPICGCPPRFSLLDDTNQYGGCKPNDPVSCEPTDTTRDPEEVYYFETLMNTDWPTSDYEQLQPTNMEECKKSCLHDCMCDVAVLRGDSCWKKKLPLSNGRVDLSESGRGRAFLKVRRNPTSRSPTFPFPAENKNRDSLFIVIAALFGSSVFVNFLLLSVICIGVFLLNNKRLKASLYRENVVESNVRCFTYKDLAEATNGFKEELGRGSFGTVYKGEIHHGGSKIPIAVKKLYGMMEDGEKEFKAEVSVIGQTHHKNLVRLLGFCNEGESRLLVYEYLSNGTLASLLFGESRPGWSQRTRIALGIGRGLVYLHEECSTQVIHCDIKPQNILLDEYYNARIADFGLAKLLMLNQSKTHTGIRGTKGYVGPEWFRNKPITVKVDVYSFGVMLMEIICCRRNVEMKVGGEEREILCDWAYECYRNGVIESMVDDDEEVLSDMRKLERYVMVAIWCIQEDPSLRPSMRKVMMMLEGIVVVGPPPCPFPYDNSISIL